MYKVMIIEDDESIRSLVKVGLEKWGYSAYVIKNFENVIMEYTEYKPHLIILDINLPYFDGFYWCSKIRELSQVPIIFLSSRDSEADKIRGISQGGDDYIEKPFSMDLLLTKINATLRRTYAYKDNSLNTIEHNELVLDIESNTAFYKEQNIRLTSNESKILSMLIKNSNKVMPRYRLIKALWDDESFVDDNTLTVNINRIRKKLKELGRDNYIVTVKGEGYRLS